MGLAAIEWARQRDGHDETSICRSTQNSPLAKRDNNIVELHGKPTKTSLTSHRKKKKYMQIKFGFLEILLLKRR